MKEIGKIFVGTFAAMVAYGLTKVGIGVAAGAVANYKLKKAMKKAAEEAEKQ
jgi:hypothetical protein